MTRRALRSANRCTPVVHGNVGAIQVVPAARLDDIEVADDAIPHRRCGVKLRK
ncbi:MAG TPA: hypothetical protein VGQ46_11710 [Thermoanaerobaculia bacterium]|jgi:hypothetical protein|nr:hypothetical protein [Thermoanaerobaculia bacterium]